MKNNKITWKSSGGNTHKFLMKESFRYLKNKGFKVELEQRIGKGMIDVLGIKILGIKRSKMIGIECVLRPTLNFVRRKIDLYGKDLDELIFCYPKEYQTNFPIEDFCKVITFKLPRFLNKETFPKTDKIKPEDLIRLKKIREKYPNKIIGLITSSAGQKRLTVPKQKETKNWEQNDLIELKKVGENE